MESGEVAERLLRAARSAALEATADENEFASLISATRRSFRRPLLETSRNNGRGRKRKRSFTRKVFLMKLSHADFLPGNTEQTFLRLRGLGEASKSFCINRNWTMPEIKENIKHLYAPHIQNLLHMCDFSLAKADRSKRLTALNGSLTGEDLEKELGSSRIIIIPFKDFPSDLPIVEPPRTTAAGSSTPTSTRSQQDQPSPRTSLRSREQQPDSDSDGFDFEDVNSPSASETTDAEREPEVFTLPMLGEDSEVLAVAVDRNNCVSEVFSIYADEAVLEKKLSVSFKDELGVDGGGLTKELFSVFFKGLEGVYLRGEDCLVPFLDLNNMGKKDQFILIGRVIIHMLLLTGTVPPKLSRVMLLLLGRPEEEIKEEALLEDLLNYVNPCLRGVMKKALISFSDLKPREKAMLEAFFQSAKFFALPDAEKIREQLVTIATDILIEQPGRLIAKIRLGICMDKYKNFWSKCDFNVLLDMQKVTANKVANCLNFESTLTNEESDVAHYFEMYVRCLRPEDVERLVFLITGSFLMPLMISVRFSDLVGLAMRPTFITCTDTIVLPKTYTSYEELKHQLNICLNSEEAQMYSTY